MQRIPPSQRLGEQLTEILREGLSGQNDQREIRGILIRLGAQRLRQELLEAEQRDFLGADRYERAGARQGQRNGYAPAHVASAEGQTELQAPQVRNNAQPFESKLLGFLKGRTEIVERLVTEMYAHGLSTRDIEAAFTDATGAIILSKSAVSEVTERFWQEYQSFREQRWDGIEIVYLFADGLYEPMQATGNSRDAILCLWAICGDGRKRLLDVVVGNRESRDAWLEGLRGLVMRGLRAPRCLWPATVRPALRPLLRRPSQKHFVYLRCPPSHHKFIRTTNLAAPSIEEEQRRMKTIPRFFNEKSCLELCFASLIRASQRWQRVTITDFERTQLGVLREQLHQEYLKRLGKAEPVKPSSTPAMSRETTHAA